MAEPEPEPKGALRSSAICPRGDICLSFVLSFLSFSRLLLQSSHSMRAAPDTPPAPHGGSLPRGVPVSLALSCMVTCSGPDPRLLKASRRPFYTAADGVTSFSTTGVLLPPTPRGTSLFERRGVLFTAQGSAATRGGQTEGHALPLMHVLVPASAVTPFLTEAGALLPGTRVEALLGPLRQNDTKRVAAPRPCTLVGLIDAPPVGRATSALVGSRNASGNPWVVGWAATSTHRARGGEGGPAGDSAADSLPPSSAGGPTTLQDVLDSRARLRLRQLPERLPRTAAATTTTQAATQHQSAVDDGADPRRVGQYAVLLVAPPPQPDSTAGPRALHATAEATGLMEATSTRRRREDVARAAGLDLRSDDHATSVADSVEEDTIRLALAVHAWRRGLIGHEAELATPDSSSPYPSTSAVTSWASGTRVHAAGSPFGTVSPQHFAHGIVSGVVSASFGEADTMLLVDMRALPGMEGAPICDDDGALLGVLAPPLRLRDGSAEIPLAVRSGSLIGMLAAVLGPLLDVNSSDDANAAFELPPNYSDLATGSAILPVTAPVVEAACAAIVLCQHSSGAWASGICIGGGCVLTVSHLFPTPPRAASTFSGDVRRAHSDTQLPSVSVRFVDGSWSTARAIYVAGWPLGGGTNQDADDGMAPLDVAVLILQKPAPVAARELAPRTDEVCAGMPVAVIGHPLFGPSLSLSPCVSIGVVSRTIPVDGVPAMLQTSAAVHAGSSGGAVVDSSGNLVALITSNATHTRGGTLPHLNFAIPVQPLLRPIWDVGSSNRDRDVRGVDEALRILSCGDSSRLVRRAWHALLPGGVRSRRDGVSDAAPGGARLREFLSRAAKRPNGGGGGGGSGGSTSKM